MSLDSELDMSQEASGALSEVLKKASTGLPKRNRGELLLEVDWSTCASISFPDVLWDGQQNPKLYWYSDLPHIDVPVSHHFLFG